MLRKEKELSRQAVADNVGFSQQEIERIEKGKHKSINREFVAAFARFFNCTSSFLVGAAEDRNGLWREDGKNRKMSIPVLFDDKEKAGPNATFLKLLDKNPDAVDICVKVLKLEGNKKKHVLEALKSMLNALD